MHSNHWHIFQCLHQDRTAKLNLEEVSNTLRLNFNVFDKISARITKNIDGNQNDALFTCVVLGAFFCFTSLQMYLPLRVSFQFVAVFQPQQTQTNIRKKLNASLPVIKKRHRDFSLSTLPMHHHSIVCFCMLLHKRTHAAYTHTKSIHKAARLSVQIHSNRNVATWQYIRKKK